jgi:hypothetical protein
MFFNYPNFVDYELFESQYEEMERVKEESQNVED